jgi:FkbM family methyltransferase
MNTYNHPEELAAAEQEIISDYGETYRHYAHDLTILRRLCSMGFSPKTVYDVGSSDGIWTSMAIKALPGAQFEMFEPLADLSEEYRGTLQSRESIRALLEAKRARVHAVALGACDGSCRMTVYPRTVGSTSLTLDHDPPDTMKIEVPMFALENYVRKNALCTPSLLKLDTQGSELDILRGAGRILKDVDAVLCECWLFKGYGSQPPLWLEIANHLSKYGLMPFEFAWEYRRTSDQRTATIDILFLRCDLPFSPLASFPHQDLK